MRPARMLLKLGFGCAVALLAAACAQSPTAPGADDPPTSPPPPGGVNNAPVVFVRGADQSCHPARTPAGVTPCMLRLTAYARDPDGDPLSYSWSGCAVGNNPGADCVVNAIGAFHASVEVSDGRGGVTTSRVELRGVNRPAAVELPGAPAYLGTHTRVELYGVLDDDDAVCSGDFFMDVDASGACGPYVRPECRGGPNVVMIELRTHDPGTCHVSVRLKDAWGVTSVTPFSFEVEER